MIRTQIYIPETIHDKLIRLAQEKREPMAKIVREMIEDGIEKTQVSDRSGVTTLQAIAQLKFKGGPKDLSANLDHYLYGGPKNE